MNFIRWFLQGDSRKVIQIRWILKGDSYKVILIRYFIGVLLDSYIICSSYGGGIHISIQVIN